MLMVVMGCIFLVLAQGPGSSLCRTAEGSSKAQLNAALLIDYSTTDQQNGTAHSRVQIICKYTLTLIERYSVLHCCFDQTKKKTVKNVCALRVMSDGGRSSAALMAEQELGG